MKVGDKRVIRIEPSDRKRFPMAIPDGTVVTLTSLIGAKLWRIEECTAFTYFEHELLPYESKTLRLLKASRASL